jgi:hypothetical protein
MKLPYGTIGSTGEILFPPKASAVRGFSHTVYHRYLLSLGVGVQVVGTAPIPVMQEEVEKSHAAQQDRRSQDGVRLLDAHVCRDHVMSESAAAIRMVRGFWVAVTIRIVLSGSRSG